MTEMSKITAAHLARLAIVYLRQSSASQVENNRESTERQYALSGRARELGWPAECAVVIDEHLGLSVPAASCAAGSLGWPARWPWPGRHSARPRGLAAGAQQRRLA